VPGSFITIIFIVMGRQRGLIHITGQYDDVQLSIDGKRGVSKLSVPLSKERIMTDPDFDLTRKNMAEFTGAAYAAKTLRKCMGEGSKRFAERYLQARLMGLTRRILNSGPGDGGERSFEVVPNLADLKNIELNREEPFGDRFRPDFTLTPNVDRNTVLLDVPSFDARYSVVAPSGATHFRLLMCAGVLSDFEFTGTSEQYAPLNPLLDGKRNEVVSPTLAVNGLVTGGIQLTAILPGLPILPTTAGLVVCVGIEFFRRINGNDQLFASGNVMKIAETF
jgi:hypothetical protein